MSEDFPADATAGGFRPGACNELACHMPAEIAVHVTGHDLRHLSSLWDYVDALRTLAMPGALVLASFPALPWGQLGKGPAPPSLDPIEQEAVGLECAMNHFFKLDSLSPSQMMQGGHLRPMMRAAFAR
eukprot:9471764-Pyramimonas_sp.AAC.1